MEQHQFGLREWADLCERKDATIAALQARVQELEAQHEDLVERNRILRHRPDLPVERTEFHDRFVKLQSQLTQRTAELEAVKADTKNMLDVATRRLHEQVNDLQAELERVRGELQSAEAGYFVAERELQGANNKYDELRTLILALPKVEGEIAVKRTEVDLSDVWGITLNGYFTFQSALFDSKEEADAYAAILKHRQGMEA